MPGTVLFTVSPLGELELDRARCGYLLRISLQAFRSICLAQTYHFRDLELPKTVLWVKFSHNRRGSLTSRNRSARPKMRANYQIPLGKNTESNDKLVRSAPTWTALRMPVERPGRPRAHDAARAGSVLVSNANAIPPENSVESLSGTGPY